MLRMHLLKWLRNDAGSIKSYLKIKIFLFSFSISSVIWVSNADWVMMPRPR